MAQEGVMTARTKQRLWTVEDVGEFLGVPVRTLYDWRGRGYGPTGKKVRALSALRPSGGEALVRLARRRRGVEEARFVMGRPPLPVGTYGKIRVYEMGEKRYRACTLYRDYDGVTRPVERIGRSRTAAADNLRKALRDRGRGALDGEITPDTKVAAVAELWLQEIDESDRAVRTKLAYRDVWNRVGVPAVGQLRIRDMRVSQVDRLLREVRHRTGLGTAHHLKGILGGVLGLAVRHDAIDANPVRGVGRARSSGKSEKVTVTTDSLGKLRIFMRDSEDARKHDLVDLVDVLSGLGCRIGELLALDWMKVTRGPEL
jgi:hypothetical protein